MSTKGGEVEGGEEASRKMRLWGWFVAAGCLGVLVGSILTPRQPQHSPYADSWSMQETGSGMNAPVTAGSARPPKATPEQIVAGKVQSFAQDRQHIAYAMARRLHFELPGEVDEFFEAVAAGRWDDINKQFEKIKERRDSDVSGNLRRVWGPILETLLVAECAHAWPAQKLLDYGQATLGALAPGTVYVGGTDPGRGIPTLLNETSGGEHHIVLTQNGLADGTYLEYLRFLYGNQMDLPTEQETSEAFSDYIQDALKRSEHDRQFPNEPRQIQAGEEVEYVEDSAGPQTTNRAVKVSGNVAVMAINERILRSIMDKNPGMSFALEESFPLRSTYDTAAPLGPIMQLRATDSPDSFNQATASEVLDYWRTANQTLMSDPEAPEGSDVCKTYSHMAWSQGNLLADHHYLAEAEQTYRLAMQIEPRNPEAVYSLAGLLSQAGRTDEAHQLLQKLAANPGPPEGRPPTPSITVH